MFLFYKREGLKGVKSMSFDFSGWGAGEVLLAMMLSSKIFVFKPFRIIAGLLNNVLHLVLHLLLFISSILADIENQR